MRKTFLLILFLCALTFPARANDTWTPDAQSLLRQAMTQDAGGIHPQYWPTSDGKSFVLVWYAGKNPPQKWLVSLAGTHGYATRDLAVWHPALKDKPIGFISLQWWLGNGDDTRSYYTPFEIYRALDQALNHLHVAPHTALLHGFSRGSANIYAVAALDAVRGHQYFSTVIANSGQATPDYPPTRLINNGEFGATPFTGQNWITSCGERDPNPDRDGCPAMRRTADWIKNKGGNIIMRIEDKNAGHGALNTNPVNAARVLDVYLKK